MKSNVLKYYLHMMMNIVVIMLAGGSILQAFLMESGLSEENVNFLMSASQMLQIGVMLGLSKAMDKNSNIIKVSAYARFCDLPLMLAMLALCFAIPGNKAVLFAIIFFLLVIYSIGIGITNISSYKLPYLVIDVNDYGRITAIGGVVGGILTAVMSWGMSYLQQSFEYFSVMKWMLLMAIISLAIYIISTATLKEMYQHQTSVAEEKKKINILKYKPFLHLIIPNALRGFNAGFVNIAVTIGYFVKLIDGATATLLVVVSNVVTIVGCFVFSRISGKIRDGIVLLVSSIAVAIAMPMMLLGNNTTIFIVFYGVTFFFYNIVNYAVPAAVVKFVDYDVAGQYNAGRMILHTLGISLAGFVCVAMFKLIGPLVTLIFAGGCQLVSGLGYYMFLNKRKSDL